MYISATLTHPDPVLGFHPPAPLHGNGVVVLDFGDFRLIANNPANPPAVVGDVVDVLRVTVDGSLPMANSLAGVLEAVRDKMINILARK